jgi:hypothetical protein
MKSLKTADLLQQQLDNAILRVQKKGKAALTHHQANSISNATGKKLSICVQQMKYAAMTKVVPYIPLLETRKPK